MLHRVGRDHHEIHALLENIATAPDFDGSLQVINLTRNKYQLRTVSRTQANNSPIKIHSFIPTRCSISMASRTRSCRMFDQVVRLVNLLMPPQSHSLHHHTGSTNSADQINQGRVNIVNVPVRQSKPSVQAIHDTQLQANLT